MTTWTTTVALTPPGWSGALVLTKQKGSKTGTLTFSTLDDIYLDWSFINDGSTAALSRTYFDLYIDGSFFEYFYFEPPLPDNTYYDWLDFELGYLTPGSHTIEMIADDTDVIPESNEHDNTTTVNVLVGSPARKAAGISAKTPARISHR